MITPEYCRQMARYNAWQNKSLRACIEALPVEELTRDRGAFFGSIIGTANHLLWGDTIWMARFTGGDFPSVKLVDSTTFTPTPAEWVAQRIRLDARISYWADHLSALDLVGDLTWYSGATKRQVSKPIGTCIAHFFNHQTHHRGQVHAMLTAAGQTPDDTDLVFMPES